jgi:penicillin-binding protein 1A
MSYTRYQSSSEPVSGRARRRRGERKQRGTHKWRWLQLAVIVLLLLTVALVAAGVGAIVAVSRNLPALDERSLQANAQTTYIYDRNGQVIAMLHGAENRTVVPSKAIPTIMKEAAVAVEDKRFYEHHGVDFQGLFRALWADLRAGHVVQGGSTITEQFVKQVYVGNEPNLTRKIREAVLAWKLEDKWSKDRILTAYLNTSYFGAGAYGVEAAAERYFHKKISAVTLPQAALLAGLLRTPSQTSPIEYPKLAKQRRDEVLDLMDSQGYITSGQLAGATHSKLGVYEQPMQTEKDPAAYFVSYVTQQLVKKYGYTQTFEGGLRVYTSIDMHWQQEAINSIKSTIGSLNFGGWKPAGALVAIEPQTGYIRAMVGGTDFEKQQFNLAWQSRRQAGSAFKPFTLTAAVSQGMNPATTYYVSHNPTIIPMGPGAAPWVVMGENLGRVNVEEATWLSDNTVFAQLCMDVGPANVVAMAHKMGITTPLEPVPSITLGTQVVNPLEMADAYATLPSGGVHHPPQAIEKVVLPNGRVDWRPNVGGNRVISDGVAYEVTSVLEGVTTRGTAANSASYFPYMRAGKTGTTDNGTDLWFVGYTPQLVTAVWMGYPGDFKHPMPALYGATYCVPMWGRFMDAALRNEPHPNFAPPKHPVVFGNWLGKYATSKPSGSPSPSKSSSPGTHTATPKPTPTTPKPKPTTPKPTPTTPKPTPTTPKPSPPGGAQAQAKGYALGSWAAVLAGLGLW